MQGKQTPPPQSRSVSSPSLIPLTLHMRGCMGLVQGAGSRAGVRGHNPRRITQPCGGTHQASPQQGCVHLAHAAQALAGRHVVEQAGGTVGSVGVAAGARAHVARRRNLAGHGRAGGARLAHQLLVEQTAGTPGAMRAGATIGPTPAGLACCSQGSQWQGGSSAWALQLSRR